jgi:DNA-binding XRE family transcriptional regulator
LIRNPINRLISEWNSISTRENHPFHKYVLSNHKLTFEDYISLDIFENDFKIPDNVFMGAGVKNHQTRFYNGFLYSKSLPYDNFTVNDTLEIAKSNIKKHFLLIGMIEKYDEYLLLLKKLLKWDYKDICYPHMKLNKSKNQKIEISKKTISLIEKNNINDMELYEFVCKRFDKQISQFGSFQNDLEYFQKFNHTYGDIYIKYFYNFYKRVHNKVNLIFN